MSKNGKFLLDTNIIIALFAKDNSIQTYLSQINEVFLSCIVVGELYFGAKKSKNVEQNMKKIDEFIATNLILDINAETAKIYSDIKYKLRRKGRPIPENDIWISATAQQYGLTLATRDEHFKEIEGLQYEIW